MPEMYRNRRDTSVVRTVTVIAVVALGLIASALPAAAATGPYLVRDIKPGAGHSSPADLVAFNGRLLFTAGDGTRGRELWRSDGTSAGTKRVKDILPGGGGSNARYLTPCGSQVFFSANDGRGQELWRTDGTSAGTFMVKNIKPGRGNSFPEAELSTVFVCLSGVAYFAARDGVHGPELWRSDGSRDGTYLVADIVAGEQGSEPEVLAAYKGRLYFRTATQLWRSDGTSAGTRPVRKQNGNIIKAPTELVVAGPTLFFAVNGALWRSDGTTAGTSNLGVSAEQLTDVGGVLYFTNFHNQLARSDGTPTGTYLVRDLPQQLSDMTDVGGTLYFTSDGELWISDGTEPGTHLVDPSGPFGGGQLTDVAGTLYFAANHDEPGETCCSPSQLWRSDGTAAGTVEVAPTPDSPVWLTVAGDTLFFRGTAAEGRELWAYVP